MTFEHPCRNQLNPKTVFWTNVGKIVLIYKTQFYNVKWVEKKPLLNLVFGSKMGTQRNEWGKKTAI